MTSPQTLHNDLKVLYVLKEYLSSELLQKVFERVIHRTEQQIRKLREHNPVNTPF